MKQTLAKIVGSVPFKIYKSFLESRYLPFVVGGFSLLCYYMGWDVPMMYVLAIIAIPAMFITDELSPFISVVVFIPLLISMQHTPSIYLSDTPVSGFYFQKSTLAHIFLLISIFVLSAIYCFVRCVINKKFIVSPMFLGLCALALVIFLNGIFSNGYTPKNLLYGLIVALCLLGIYLAFSSKSLNKEKSFIPVAYAFFTFAVVLVTQLIVAYATTDGIFTQDGINRKLLFFGWGIYNTMGAYLVLCIPFVVYLAGKDKLGPLFMVFSMLLFVACIMSCSRQAIVSACIIYPVSLFVLFFKGKYKLINAGILLTCVIVLVILGTKVSIIFKYFKELFERIVVNGQLSGNGRMNLWKEAIEHFKKVPIFGLGFYVEFSYRQNVGLGFVPPMCHNTLFEFLSACGIVGFTVYCIHRVQTVTSYLKNVNVERTAIMLSVLALLIVSLADNHFFNLFPTVLYALLILVLDKTEEKKNV